MTRKVPIWLQDDKGRLYHVKLDKDNDPYIIAESNQKASFGSKLEDFYIGLRYECADWFGDNYTVVRNDLLQA